MFSKPTIFVFDGKGDQRETGFGIAEDFEVSIIVVEVRKRKEKGKEERGQKERKRNTLNPPSTLPRILHYWHTFRSPLCNYMQLFLAFASSGL